MDKYLCLRRAGQAGGKRELSFAVRAVWLPAALPDVSRLRAYGSGAVMRTSSDNSSLMFTGFHASRGIQPLYYFLDGLQNRE